MRAACDPAISSEIESIYADVRREIEERGPACWASGRCCNFDRTGHRLYATGLEVALTIRGVSRARADGAEEGATLTRETLADALQRGGCPFQTDNLCGAHPHRPLGCRVYFCDQTAERWQQDLCERALARIKALHERRAIPYTYGEWRTMLGSMLDAGFSS